VASGSSSTRQFQAVFVALPQGTDVGGAHHSWPTEMFWLSLRGSWTLTPAENRYGKVVKSGGPLPGVTLSQLRCGALLPSLCCVSVLGHQQSPRSLVTLEKNEVIKNLSSGKMERKKS